MAGSCCGRTFRVDPRLDPAACNALQQTASGLLVPRAALQGVAPGGALGTDRSVDIDVQAPAAGSCPETWTVGARLTPVAGQTSGVVALDASPANTWVPVTGAQLVLPEAGLYEVIADVQCSIGWSAGVGNAIIDAQIFDVTAGAAVPLSARRVILFTDSTATGVTGIQANASASALYRVAGPATIRVEGSWRTDVGSTFQKVVWAQNFRFKKVGD
ncbi:hypothetical protein F5972_08150 [Microbispora cellulosiformans]|uniref:Uncharacterized protein n=1 Tax=Microbispora cellulosiformans TaxID=2614688 RepID=A0A5J5K749_9ACTN|nr:hypothetical protein [Microbispora cellulosiformans]KAA9379618.1 hypothetical protein F5972_08150 [Microbispora cellulosiformans]